MRMIRPVETAKKLSVSATTLWRYQKDPDFPRAFQLGPNVIAFDEDEIDTWLAARRVRPEQPSSAV